MVHELIQSTHNDDDSAKMTVSIGPEDYRFTVSPDGIHASVEYEETLTERGEIEVSEPGPDVFKTLAVSDEMTAYLDEHGLNGVRRAD